MLMGIATFLVALVPTYESVGIWGAVILTVLRFVQGVGVGGEWGGSVLMSMEWARSNSSRGLVASWPQFGVPCGLFLANLAVLAFSQMSGDQFLTWGASRLSSWSASGSGSGSAFWRPRSSGGSSLSAKSSARRCWR
jgi:MFS family permease